MLVVEVTDAVNSMSVPVELICRSVNWTTPFPPAVPMLKFVLPSSGPVPALNATTPLRVAGNPFVDGLPFWSAVLSTGCCANGHPLVANPGCLVQINWVAGPGNPPGSAPPN